METRELIAYGLIALMAIGAIWLYVHLTRDARKARREWNRDEPARQRRQAEARANDKRP